LIEAARAALICGDVPRLELGEVAQRAGVARSTVYLSFGTRSGFLSRILDDSLSRAGFGRLGEYLMLPDAVEALEKSLRQAAVMYSAEHAILGRMLLLARIDAEAARLYHEKQQNRAVAMRDLALRLRRQRKLRPRISTEAAAGVLWVLTSFETFDQLFSGWGLDASECGSQIVMMARAALLEPP
jgi:AcrR family transcriptional regulator